MNIKQTVKKVTALATGTLMLGATVMGAVAYDLSDYPYPFIQNGAFSGKIVVGTRGSAEGIASDYLGIADISTSLQAASKTPVSVSGTVTVEGGEVIDTLDLNEVLTGTTLTNSDIESLLDTQIRWDSKNVDVYEEIEIPTAAGLKVATYYPGSGNDDDFETDPFLVVGTAGQIKYKYVFDSNIAGNLSKKPLEIKFLGKTLKITEINSGSMSIEASSEYFMEEGDKVMVDGHEVTLVRVGASAVLVRVDGQTKTVTSASLVTFDQADDFEVELISSFYIEGASDNSATLQLGKSLTDDVSDGDSLELFGEPEDETEAEWVWEINVAGADTIVPGDYIAAVHNIVRTKKNVDGDDERAALAPGESIDFPNNYASIEFTGMENSVQTKYDDLRIKPVNTKLGNTYLDAIELSTTADKDSFYIYQNNVLIKKTSKVYVANDTAVYDGDKDVAIPSFNASHRIGFKLNKEELSLNMSTSSPWTLTDPAGDVFNLTINSGFTGFGATKGTAEPTDVIFNAKNIGEDDKSYRTTYGIIFKDVEKMMDSNPEVFTLSVPHEQQVPIIVVSGKGATKTNTDTGAYVINPLPVGLVVKDTEAQNMLGSENLLVVGGPYVNSIAAQLMGNPTAEQIEQMFEPGRAKIVLFDNQNAILVAGYTAQDTVGASRVLAKYETYDLTGKEVEVVVPSLASLRVTTPTLPSTVDNLNME